MISELLSSRSNVLKKPFAWQIPSQPALFRAFENEGAGSGKLDAMTLVIGKIRFLLIAAPASSIAGTKLGQCDFGREITLIFATEGLRRIGVLPSRLPRSKLWPEAALVHNCNIESSKRLLSNLAEGADTCQAHSRRNPLRLNERSRRIRAGAHDVAARKDFVELVNGYHFHAQGLFVLAGEGFAAFRPQTVYFDLRDRTNRADCFCVAARLIASTHDTEDAGIRAA